MRELSSDTIFAAATPAAGTITIVRVSGPSSRFVVETLAGRVPRPRHASLMALREPAPDRPTSDTSGVLDHALVIFFPGPASYTGEDSAEFHLHGGRAVLSGVTRALLALGLRPAQPGEFTRRAFLNDRMDLAEAEGLADLLAAETEAQKQQAFCLLDGALGRSVEQWQAALTRALAFAEAELDFSDERDVPEGLLDQARALAAGVASDLSDQLRRSERAEQIREGFVVAIVGAPNAGKSSLLNAIAQRDVAIVSEIAGTTRDLIEVRCNIAGWPVTLVDTAGLRETEDAIELMGIARARKAMAGADLLLHLEAPDDPTPVRGEVQDYPSVIIVRSKSDLRRLPSGEEALEDGSETIAISVVTGDGLDSLLDRIAQLIDSGPQRSEGLISRERHRAAVVDAATFLAQVADVTRPSELVAEDLRQARSALSVLTGKVSSDEVLDAVFSSFCIGK